MGVTTLLLFAVALPSITALQTQLHKHMTPNELRNVFHVEHHSLVPEYQVIQLNHHVSKRHVASAGNERYKSGNTIPAKSGKKSAHDKLSSSEIRSKNAHKFVDFGYEVNYPPAPVDHIGSTRYGLKVNEEPFSPFDSLSESGSEEDLFVPQRTNSGILEDNSNLSDTSVQVNGGSISEEVVDGNGEALVKKDDRNKNSRQFEDVEHLDESLDDGVHRIKFEAFGKPIELVLRKTEGLFKKEGLKLFTVVGNETEPHGVEFIENEPDQESDDIGETYQDEETQAALVIRRDPHAGLLVDGSIGHDLVIKPLPSTLSSKISRSRSNPSTIPPDQDDEMFMDPNQDDMVSIDTGLPIKKHAHVKKNLSTDKPEVFTAATIPIDAKNMGINKMDTDEVLYDDAGAKEESRKFYGSRRVTREALIEALSGAKHVIFKRDVIDDHNEELSDYAFMEPDRLGKRFQRQKRSSDYEVKSDSRANRRAKREAPYVIYPEILVIVDYDGYRLHGGDNLQIKRYFVSFWNGVDLRYKLLKGPKIRISIAGIIISRGRDATPYLERNRVGRDAIDSAAALTDMGKYLFRERRLPVYDIAVAVTKLDMCRRQYANDVCNRGTAGFAYVGGACVVNKRLEKVNSVAIIEDTGGFSGIIVAAHEVGHLLGAVHDGSPPPSYLGGPGAEKCRWEDGFIMSDLRHTEKGFRWSPCSVLSFHHFLNGDTATCLYNSPHEDESLPRVLPGKLLSLDAQCRKDRGTSACFKDERVCAQLFCFDSGSGYCVAYRPAAEGSPCGDGQYCINGRCVAEHENIIPDYSHHTPSYIRRDTSPYYANDTVHRYLLDQTTQAYGTYPSSPYQQTHYYHPSTGQSPQTYVEPQSVDPYSQYTTQAPYRVVYNTNPATKQTYSYSPYYSTTRNPYDFRNFQLYQYTAETKQTQYTLPSSSSSSQAVSTEATSTTTSTTASPFFFKYSYSSTKNPYDFKEFATKRPFPKVTTVKENLTSNTVGTTTEKSNTFNITTTTAKSSFPTTKQQYGFISKLDLRNYFNRTTTKNPYDFDLTNYKEIPNNNIKRSYSVGSYYGSQNRPVANFAEPNATSAVQASENVPVVRPSDNRATRLVSLQ